MRIFIIILFPFALFSQSIFGEAVPKHISLAGATVSDTTFISIYTNPSGAVYSKQINVGVGYSNRFLFQELSVKNIGVIFPFHHTNIIGITYGNYGYSDYSLNKFSLSYARQIGDLFSASLQVNYHFINLVQRNNIYAFSIDIGLQVVLSKKIRLGAYIQNPTLAKYIEKEEKLPFSIRLGGRYRVVDKIFTFLELEKYMTEDMVYKFGFSYHFNNSSSMTIGTSNGLYTLGFGVSLFLKFIRLGIAFVYHPQLKYISSISALYK